MAKDGNLTCPPLKVGQMITYTRRMQGRFTKANGAEFFFHMSPHAQVAEVICCHPKTKGNLPTDCPENLQGIKLRTIESRWQQPGGLSCIEIWDSKGNLLDSSGKGCVPPYRKGKKFKHLSNPEEYRAGGKPKFEVVTGGWTDAYMDMFRG